MAQERVQILARLFRQIRLSLRVRAFVSCLLSLSSLGRTLGPSSWRPPPTQPRSEICKLAAGGSVASERAISLTRWPKLDYDQSDHLARYLSFHLAI